MEERYGRSPKHRVLIDGNIYDGTATLKRAVRLYRDFRSAGGGAAADSTRNTDEAEVSEQGGHVTSDQFRAGQAEVRSEIADLRAEQRTGIAGVCTEITSLETKLIRWMVGTVLVTAAWTFGILWFLTQ